MILLFSYYKHIYIPVQTEIRCTIYTVVQNLDNNHIESNKRRGLLRYIILLVDTSSILNPTAQIDCDQPKILLVSLGSIPNTRPISKTNSMTISTIDYFSCVAPPKIKDKSNLPY